MSRSKMATMTIFAVLMTAAVAYAFALGPSTLLKPISVEAEKTMNNNTSAINISNNLILGNPFYEATSGKVIGQRVLGFSGDKGSAATALPQVELSTIQDATIKGVENVTNMATWINTFKTGKIVYGVGKGIITTKNGEMATWVASDVGRPDDKGVITYRGLIFFNTVNSAFTTAPGGKLSFLDNMEALFITQVNVSSSDRPQATKMWEWR
jgi:hypothetical protein